MYSVGMSPPNAAAALTAFDVLRREPQRVSRLRQLAGRFRDEALQKGLIPEKGEPTPVVPLVVGNAFSCVSLFHQLKSNGIWSQPIIDPAVKERISRLRFFVTCTHTDAQIRESVDVIAKTLAEGAREGAKSKLSPRVQTEG